MKNNEIYVRYDKLTVIYISKYFLNERDQKKTIKISTTNNKKKHNKTYLECVIIAGLIFKCSFKQLNFFFSITFPSNKIRRNQRHSNSNPTVVRDNGTVVNGNSQRCGPNFGRVIQTS